MDKRVENSSQSGTSFFNKYDKYLNQKLNVEKEPLKAWPKGVNPHTGESGGPKGLEPTRYGDWEGKGRCSDF